MHKLAFLGIAVASLVLLPACPLIEVEVDVQEVCFTYQDLKIDAQGETDVNKSFVFDDLHGVQQLTDVEADIEFLHVKLRAKSGITDFSFIDAAHVTIASGAPGSTLPVIDVVDCGNGSCPTSGAEVTLTSDAKASALDYIRSGSILVDVDVSGHMPDHSFSVDVDVCVKGTVKVTQGI
jgi:hypothetical protein